MGEAVETVLIVDDEEPVRRTFREWLDEADLSCRVLTAGDAAAALALADQHQIDLAILDWNLGAGQDGLQLLEDLTLFNPDIVAIMVTGFANQATPLMAMRMGVRDYLDKNQDLDRTAFIRAVRKQLERIRPARREKQLTRNLAAFRDAVERILPLVQTTTALQDPVPLPVAVRSLVTFLLSATHAQDGVLLVHQYDESRQPAESCRAYDAHGQRLEVDLAPFSRSLAGCVVSMQQPQTVERLDRLTQDGTIELQPFERGRGNILAAPIRVSSGLQVVLELFDKPEPFTAADRKLVQAAAEFGGDLLRQGLAEHQTQQMLFDAVAAALRASEEVSQTLGTPRAEMPPDDVMEQLRQGLSNCSTEDLDASAMLRLAEAIRVLALRYGSRAVAHCTRLVEELRQLLDETCGQESGA